MLVEKAFIKEKDCKKNQTTYADPIKTIFEVILSSASTTTGNRAAALT